MVILTTTIFFTSITPNYLAKARVLCRTLKKHNPDAFFILGICDSGKLDQSLLKNPFDGVIEFDSLDYIVDKKSFLFKHSVSELCTAVKPFYADKIIKEFNAEKVIYLDPDVAVFDSLEPLLKLLDKYSILLTPHQLKKERDDLYIRENEILFLKRGSFNLGFFGVKSDNQGLEFLKWWQSRLYHYCFDDNYEVLPELERNGLLGLFTDQKWIDLVPSFFPNHHIVRDPGYNVCTWNLTNRKIHLLNNGKFLIDGLPLRFFHFSGYDSGAHRNEVQKLLMHYPLINDVKKLDDWYDNELAKEGQEEFGKLRYSYTVYQNGQEIQDFERKIYHIRKDIHNIFPDPFQIENNEPCFHNWVREEYGEYFEKFQNPNKQQEELFALLMFNRWFPRGSRRRRIISLISKKLFYLLKPLIQGKS